jgi:hypothetical protein
MAEARRKLPLCAHCGESLARCDRITTELTRVSGHPLVGWHSKCFSADPVAPKVTNDWRFDQDAVREILKRGRDRVTAYRVFWMLREIEGGANG